MTLLTQQVTSDSIETVLADVFMAPEYQWRSPNLLSKLGEYWGSVMAAFGALENAHPIAYWVLLGVLTVVLIAILSHFGYILWRVFHPLDGKKRLTMQKAAPIRDIDWYLRESQRAVADGRFVEAMAHRFRAMALILNRRHALSFHPSKTPAEYLAEARLGKADKGMLGDLVEVLYKHLFGGLSCAEHDAVRFDESAARLEHRVATQ